jgi:lipoprotein LprG
MSSTRRRTRAAAAAAALVLLGGPALAACADGTGSELSPPQRLEAAKTQLDETSGVRISLTADKLPKGVEGLLSAEGVGTHDPAFEGVIDVASSGVTAEVDVVAVNGAVQARLPFTDDFVEIDPADYGAPDPADLMSADGGLSSLLTAAEDVQEGEQVRDGDAVLTEVTGTVPGSAVAPIIPSASADEGFDAVFTLDDSDRLASVQLTGPFYPDAGDVTYTVGLSDYGTDQDIVAR